MPIAFIQSQTTFSLQAIQQTIALTADGATIPFIARYRKDQVDGLDEVSIAQIIDLHKMWKQIEQRKEAILHSLQEQSITDKDLLEKIQKSQSLRELEDLYLPYKPKRKTRAMAAREKGLEPLAKMLMAQNSNEVTQMAHRFVKGEVTSPDEALQGARDIVAEWVQEHTYARNQLRNTFARQATIKSKRVKGKDEGENFAQYHDFEEPLKRCPSHRFLALMRGLQLGDLRVQIRIEDETALEILHRIFIKNNTEAAQEVLTAIKDAWKRLLLPALETEFKNEYKEKSDDKAIEIFVENLKQLLLAPPLGSKRILAIDPGYKSGCKCVCLNEQGELLHNENIYPFMGKDSAVQAAAKIRNMVEAYKIEAIAVGNGTAGRETADFIESVRFSRDVKAFMVNEDGASVYSASPVGRAEFPTYDITVRGAVSIGRRLMDPLSELVKIDPKSIGVGQYQHDVNPAKLKESLERTTEFCVNAVGVNLNTASVYLLTFVSGLGASLAKNIVEHRKQHGAFSSRKSLLDVKGLGQKAFEQSAGFLRIPDGDFPLDNSAVHPEHYPVVKKMAKSVGLTESALIGNSEAVAQIDYSAFETPEIGKLILQDIISELKRPGRDPRDKIKSVRFAHDIRSITDLKIGMRLPGIITNVTKFGAFVDIGIKENGLVHISQLADRFVSDPMEVVKLQQHVMVKVLEIDVDRKRIALSMKST
ncbi:MAG: RNA-binding transcriptional accessory protein [Cryomorphaceae bacterium]|nr:RNA-binding transcriptional accessory protein [Cryomorphaceae bacterium]